MFAKQWHIAFGRVEPYGPQLRAVLGDRWFRIHSLPEGKRYCETPSEYEELLRRHHAILDHCFGERVAQGGLPEFGIGPDDRRRSTFAVVERWSRPPNDWVDEDWDFVVTGALVPASADAVLLDVADDIVDGFLFVDFSHGRIVAPYDGGCDVFVESASVRDALRAKCSPWLSSRDDQL